MVLDAAVLDNYFAMCAPDVGRPTIAAIVKVESGGNPWAINVNTSTQRWQAATYAQAVRTVKNLISAGHSVDIGLAQINSRNLKRIGMTVEEVFEPCRNLMAASTILKQCYLPATEKYGHGQKALLHALSCYNTGSMYGGRRYVQRILSAAGATDAVRRIAAASLNGPQKDTPRASGKSVLATLNGEEKWRVF